MKRVLLAVALIGLGVGIAGADENDLTGGVFICHHDPDMVGTPPEDWCQHYIDSVVSNVFDLHKELTHLLQQSDPELC